MPIKPSLEIKGQDWSKVFVSLHLDRNLENQDADRATIKIANPYGKLTGKFVRGDIVKMNVMNIVKRAVKEDGKIKKLSNTYQYKLLTGNIYTLQDGPREIEIIATCKITSLSKNMPNGLLNNEGWNVKQWVTFIIDEFNKIAADWEKIEVAEIWDSSTVITKDQMTNGGDFTFLDALDLCCEFSGGFYYFDDYDKFHFCDPSKPHQVETRDITKVSTNPVACYTQQGYHNVQTVIASSENPSGKHPAEQDTHKPIQSTYESPAVQSGEEARVVAPPLYLPYVTTEAEAQQIAKNMVANYAQYMNATQDLELVNVVINPLDKVKYSTGLRYFKQGLCSKIDANKRLGLTEGLVRRGVTDLSCKGWRQKLETCAPPSETASDDSTGTVQTTEETKEQTKTAEVKTYGQPAYAWTKDGYNFYFAEESLYDQIEAELHDRGQEAQPNSWIYINPETFDPKADPSTWEVAYYNQDQVPPAGWKMLERWDSNTAPGDIDANINKFHF